MIQSIYTSVSNADTVSVKRGTVVKSDPIPLLRDKFLGEYRTELEKAKVRKNLGIPDENSLEWGNISGFVESQTDLVDYVESKWNYTTELNGNVTNIKEAMDYALYFVTNFKGEHDAVVSIQQDIANIENNLSTLEQNINSHTEEISNISQDVQKINEDIIKLNESLLSINVDANILAWVEKTLLNSKSLEIKDEILEVVISKQDGNALQILEHQEAVEEDLENGIEAVEEILPGLYIKDLTTDVLSLEQNIITVNSSLESLSETVNNVSSYNTSTSDEVEVTSTIGGIGVGTKASELKGKSIISILDMMLFPTTVRDLIYPSLYYSPYSQIVEIGSSIVRPYLYFLQGDAGAEKTEEHIDKLTFNGVEIQESVYSNLGRYEYYGKVAYEAGEYLKDNKGNLTDKRIEEGSLTANAYVITTYPWYIGNESSEVKQTLVEFNQNSGEIGFNLSGKNVFVKLPGTKSTILSFTSNTGMGFLDVDLNGWSKSTETKNDITYQVWTKDDMGDTNIPHIINFKLEL